MNKKIKTTGIRQSTQKVNPKANHTSSTFLFTVKLVKYEMEEMVSRIHLAFFKNIYPSFKH